jgi:hypothetical protein
VKHHLANARSKVGAATTAQLVWILAPRLPEAEVVAQTDDPAYGATNRSDATRLASSARSALVVSGE